MPVVHSPSDVHVVLHAPALHVAYAPHVFPERGAPVATFAHLPTEPATSHAWHAPVHAVSQQRPSTQ